jgi:hypothetical protein
MPEKETDYGENLNYRIFLVSPIMLNNNLPCRIRRQYFEENDECQHMEAKMLTKVYRHQADYN